jgi:hypothetical protein
MPAKMKWRIDSMHNSLAFAFLACLACLCLFGISNALTISISSNSSYTDYGKSLLLSMSAGGGVAPYYFRIYDPYGTQLTTLATSNNTTVITGYYGGMHPIYTTFYNTVYKVKPPLGIGIYKLSVMDFTGVNVTNATVQVQANDTLKPTLNPANATLSLYQNVTFSNSIIGGSPPYNYTYSISGGRYDRTNNTMEFNSTGIYVVKLKARDIYNVSATAIAEINVGIVPTTKAQGNCTIIYNMSQTEVETISLAGGSVKVTENFITPQYAGVTFNGNIIRNLNSTPVQISDYYVSLYNLSWAPILHTVSVELCLGYLTPPTTTSTSTTSTTSTSTSTISTTFSTTTFSTTTIPTTTVASTTTVQPVNSTKTQSNSLNGDLEIGAVACAAIGLGLLAWVAVRGRRAEEPI